MDVYRCKGVLSVQNSDQLHTLQVVFHFKCTLSTLHWKSTSAALDPHHLGVLVAGDAYLNIFISIDG